MKIYLISWLVLSLVALIILINERRSCEILKKSYYRFLFLPWKISTFIVAGSVMTLAAPYSGDYTWDYIDASAMSLMTFITAPWTTGILFRMIRGDRDYKKVYVASCMAMFSFSWSYDGYLFLRDGFYPHTWFHNTILSSLLYFSAGLLWSLEPASKRTFTFAFERDNWPEPHADDRFRNIFLASLPFLLFGAFIIAVFILGNLFD